MSHAGTWQDESCERAQPPISKMSSVSTGGAVVAIGVSGGVVAGIVNQVAGFLRDKLGHKWQGQKDKEERDHQTELRRSQGHSDAKGIYLPKAIAVLDWVSYQLAAEFGPDVDYFDILTSTPALDDAGVAAALREIALGHPTKVVRQTAATFRDTFDGTMNDKAVNDSRAGETEPLGAEIYKNWEHQAEDLIELIHDPLPSDGDRSETDSG